MCLENVWGGQLSGSSPLEVRPGVSVTPSELVPSWASRSSEFDETLCHHHSLPWRSRLIRSGAGRAVPCPAGVGPSQSAPSYQMVRVSPVIVQIRALCGRFPPKFRAATNLATLPDKCSISPPELAQFVRDRSRSHQNWPLFHELVRRRPSLVNL